MTNARSALPALLGAAVLTLSACGTDAETPADEAPATATAEGDAHGPLRVGIKFDQPGFGLQEGSDYVGLDVDIARHIGERLGREVEFSEAQTARREELLRDGEVDLVVATYSITDERLEEVSFAGPYLIAGQGLLVRADETGITGPEDLAGRTACTATGATSADRMKEQYPEVELEEYETYTACIAELANGNVDAVTTDDAILAGFAAKDEYADEVTLVGEPFSEEELAVGLPQDSELCEDVAEALQELIDSGEWETMIEENLGAEGYTPGSGNPPTPTCHT